MAVLRTDSITKTYPGCVALDQVTVSFESGKINALLGKNGSGKSTLVKCFSGAITPNSGSIYLDDRKLSFSHPSDAYREGIVTVYQELSLVPGLTVMENILLGRLPKKGKSVMIDWKAAYKRTKELLEKMKVDINPREKVSRLSMWQCQVVEITKAMSFNPKVLMLDEPTSALAASEVDRLFDVIRELKKQGVIIIYISHKLHEIPQISDTITVLRDGALIGTVKTNEVGHQDIIKMMFGDVLIKNRPSDLRVQEEVVLQVRHLNRKPLFHDISFELRKGEVLGVAGMLGSGRTELLKSIFGADPFDSGEIIINQKKAKARPSPISMKRMGLGLTPEDRKKEGLMPAHSIKDNLCYASMDKTSFGWIESKKLRNDVSEKQVKDLQIKTTNVKSAVHSLSGGNQQKVVVGNWLNTKPQIMIYDEPTRGIDVVAKQQIFEIIWEQSRNGISSIFVSSELEELLETCHRVLIMKDGRIIGEVNPDQLEIEKLYELSMGGSHEQHS